MLRPLARLVVLTALIGLSTPALAQAQNTTRAQNRSAKTLAKVASQPRVTIDFRAAPLEDVVAFYAKLTKKNFVYNPRDLAGKTVTVLAPNPVSVSEALRALESMLAVNGLTMWTKGNFIKITPA